MGHSTLIVRIPYIPYIGHVPIPPLSYVDTHIKINKIPPDKPEGLEPPPSHSRHLYTRQKAQATGKTVTIQAKGLHSPMYQGDYSPLHDSSSM